MFVPLPKPLHDIIFPDSLPHLSTRFLPDALSTNPALTHAPVFAPFPCLSRLTLVSRTCVCLSAAELNPAPGTVASVFAQGGKLAAATPSLTSFVVLNVIMTRSASPALSSLCRCSSSSRERSTVVSAACRLFKGMGLTSVPPPLAGMFLMFFALLALPEKTSGKVDRLLPRLLSSSDTSLSRRENKTPTHPL